MTFKKASRNASDNWLPNLVNFVIEKSGLVQLYKYILLYFTAGFFSAYFDSQLLGFNSFLQIFIWVF